MEKTRYGHVLAYIKTEHKTLRRGAWRLSGDFRGDVQRTGVETHADVPPSSRRQKYPRLSTKIRACWMQPRTARADLLQEGEGSPSR
jgi:hypothetical protein